MHRTCVQVLQSNRCSMEMHKREVRIRAYFHVCILAFIRLGCDVRIAHTKSIRQNSETEPKWAFHTYMDICMYTSRAL